MAVMRTPEKYELDSLVEHLQYCPKTGELRWLTKAKGRQKGTLAGSNSHGYIRVHCGNKKYAGHRICWFLFYRTWPTQEIDHINGIRNDNRLCNLRSVSRQTNAQNIHRKQRNNTSGFLGVRFRRREKNYEASLTKNKKYVYLGVFKTPEEAHQAYLDTKRQLHEGCTI